MSALLCMATDQDAKAYETLALEEGATEPLVAFTPIFQTPDEEELYTSFEEAISDRLIALNGRLSRLSDASLENMARPRYRYMGSEYMTVPLDSITECETEPLPSQHRPGTQRGWLLSICLALFCALLGFDLMGLLILHIR